MLELENWYNFNDLIMYTFSFWAILNKAKLGLHERFIRFIYITSRLYSQKGVGRGNETLHLPFNTIFGSCRLKYNLYT